MRKWYNTVIMADLLLSAGLNKISAAIPNYGRSNKGNIPKENRRKCKSCRNCEKGAIVKCSLHCRTISPNDVSCSHYIKRKK